DGGRAEPEESYVSDTNSGHGNAWNVRSEYGKRRSFRSSINNTGWARMVKEFLPRGVGPVSNLTEVTLPPGHLVILPVHRPRRPIHCPQLGSRGPCRGRDGARLILPYACPCPSPTSVFRDRPPPAGAVAGS